MASPYGPILRGMGIGIRSAQKTTKSLVGLLENQQASHAHEYLNRVLFPVLSATDLAFGVRDLIRSIDSGKLDRQQYYARVVSVTLFQIFDDTSKIVTKKKDKESIEKLFGSESWESIQQTLRPLHQIKSVTMAKISTTRHSTLAHRDANALEQYKQITTIDPAEILLIGSQTMVLLADISRAMAETLENDKVFPQ